MANTVYDPDADEKYDTQHLKSAEERAAQDSYDREFNDIAKHYGDSAEHPLGSAETNPGKKASSSTELKAGEEKATTTSSTEDDDTVGAGYTSEGSGKKRFRTPSWVTKKRAGIAGGVAGTGIIGVLILGSITSGPLQIIHLGQILANNFSKTSSDSEDRTNHIFRYAKAYFNKDLRYTRVGPIATKFVNKAMSDFADAGVKFEGSDSLFGNPTQVTVDRGTIEKNFPETQGMSESDFKNWLNQTFDTTGFEGSGDKYTLNINNFKLQAISKLITTGRVRLMGEPKVVAAAKTRSLKKFYNLGSLFHPFTRAVDNKIKAAANAAQEKNQSPDEAEIATEEDTLAEQRAPVEEKGVSAFDVVKGFKDSWAGQAASKAAPAVGAAWMTGCLLRDSGKAIITINRDLTVVPAALQATSLVAMGSQIENGGNDVTMNQVNATLGGFMKNGQSIWGASSLMTLDGEDPAGMAKNTDDGSLKNDLPGDYKQAFSSQTVAGNLQETGNFLLDFVKPLVPTTYLSSLPVIGGAFDVCSLTTALTLLVGGLVYQGVTLATAPETGGGTVGLKFFFQQLGRRIVSEAVKYYLGAKLLGFVSNEIIHSNVAPTLAKDAFSGPLGGNLIAYGGRAAGNMAAIASGGIALAGSTASTIVGSVGQEEQQQFSSENFFARMFDTEDYRSLTSRLADDMISRTSSGFSSVLSSSLSGLLNIGNTLTGAFSSLLPKASAATSDSWTGNYDWGFPQYGIPDNMLNDPHLADPYQNAETVGEYLSSVCRVTDKDGNVTIGANLGRCSSGGPNDDGYTQQILSCFGNDLTYSGGLDGQWDVTPATGTSTDPVDIDPNSEDYQNHNCGDVGSSWDSATADQQNWRRIVMFVNDANDIKSLDCTVGDSDTSEQSCIDEGMDDASAASGSSNTTSGSTVTGDAVTLAKQVLANSNITFGSTAKADLEAAANNQKVTPGPIGGGGAGTTPCTARTPVYLDATLLQAMLNIAQKYKYEIQDIVSGHNCDSGRHPLGRAMDIFQVNGAPITWSGANATLDKQFASDVANIMVTLEPNGQWVNGQPVNMPGLGVCSQDDITPPKGLNYFVDACDELHVDTGVAS